MTRGQMLVNILISMVIFMLGAYLSSKSSILVQIVSFVLVLFGAGGIWHGVRWFYLATRGKSQIDELIRNNPEEALRILTLIEGSSKYDSIHGISFKVPSGWSAISATNNLSYSLVFPTKQNGVQPEISYQYIKSESSPEKLFDGMVTLWKISGNFFTLLSRDDFTLGDRLAHRVVVTLPAGKSRVRSVQYAIEAHLGRILLVTAVSSELDGDCFDSSYHEFVQSIKFDSVYSEVESVQDDMI